MRVSLRYLLFAVVVLCLAAIATSASFAAGSSRTYTTPGTPPLQTAVFDPFSHSGPQSLPFEMMRGAGASYVRLSVYWAAIAPDALPDGFDATDPTSPGYRWSGIDAAVAAAQAAGLTPILNILPPTPSWATAIPRSGINFAGSPSAVELGKFAQALATHYDGDNGLPDLKLYEVWNEPNLSLDLAPTDASTYRAMVNAVADSVHAVDPSNLVIAGELDPFGHPKGKSNWNSVFPFAFMRSLFCLSKGAHPHPTCSDEIHFDVWANHPYTVGGPFQKGQLADDAELGDLPRVRALLNAAVQVGHVVSSGPVQFWVTELGWATKPPRSHAASVSLAARWAGESMYQAWRSGVTLFTWFELMDYGGSGPFQSGLYFHAASLSRARPKPVLTAFRFPFVAYWHRSAVSVWGKDTTSDKQRVTIQLRHGAKGNWRTVAYVVANSNGIYRATLRLRATKKDWLRAVASGSGKSLAFSLAVPHYPHLGPWGS